MNKNISIVSAFIELTSKCNWKCKFCYAECNNYNGLSITELKKLIDELYEIGTLDITFSGGEPLMHKNAFEIFEYAKSKGFALSLYSNGSLINKSNVDRIASLFGSVDISIHSINPQIHDMLVETPGAWDKSINAIKLLKQRGCRVILKSVITKLTFTDLEKLLDFSENKLGVEMNFETTIMDTYSRNTNGSENYSITNDQLAKLKEKYPTHYYGFNVCEAIESKRKFSSICRAASETIFIDSYGNVYPCLLFKKDDAFFLDGKKWIESIKTKSLVDIWFNNIMFKSLRNLHENDFVKCNNCKSNNLCTKCIALNYIETGCLTTPPEKKCIDQLKKFSSFIDKYDLDY